MLSSTIRIPASDSYSDAICRTRSFIPWKRCRIWKNWWGKESGISSVSDISLEESDKYTVTYENMGHYGFQYMDGNTDFDILKVNITEETGND